MENTSLVLEAIDDQRHYLQALARAKKTIYAAKWCASDIARADFADTRTRNIMRKHAECLGKAGRSLNDFANNTKGRIDKLRTGRCILAPVGNRG